MSTKLQEAVESHHFLRCVASGHHLENHHQYQTNKQVQYLDAEHANYTTDQDMDLWPIPDTRPASNSTDQGTDLWPKVIKFPLCGQMLVCKGLPLLLTGSPRFQGEARIIPVAEQNTQSAKVDHLECAHCLTLSLASTGLGLGWGIRTQVCISQAQFKTEYSYVTPG